MSDWRVAGIGLMMLRDAAILSGVFLLVVLALGASAMFFWPLVKISYKYWMGG